METVFQQQFVIPFKTIWTVFLFVLLWTYLGGMNGYFFQSSDWDCRNAVYFDLIQYNWPVIYSMNGASLVYYLGHWLFPASLAKMVLWFTGSVPVSLEVGRMLLWLWSSVGVSISILMIYRVMNAKTTKRRMAVTFLFVFFSGMDLIGALARHCLGELLDPAIMHLEWWFPDAEYTSITACLFWVFNQSIIPWIITLCYFIENRPSNYVFYCVVCLLCGTLPCVGLAVLMIVKAAVYAVECVQRRENKNIFIGLFSLRNILSLFLLFPMIASYILSANTVNALKGGSVSSAIPMTSDMLVQQTNEEADQKESAEEQSVSNFTIIPGSLSFELQTFESERRFFSTKYLTWKLLAFLFLEVGLYMILIWIDHRRDPIFYALAFCFLFIPCIHVGTSNDFCMRASIPGIFILMLYVTRFLLNHFSIKKIRKGKRQILAALLAVCYLSGMATPLMEFYRGIYHVIDRKTFFLENQTLMTFNQEYINNNFLCSYPEEHFFFRYFAKK